MDRCKVTEQIKTIEDMYKKGESIAKIAKKKFELQGKLYMPTFKNSILNNLKMMPSNYKIRPKRNHRNSRQQYHKYRRSL